MVSYDDIVTFAVPDTQLGDITAHAQKAALGGKSHIRDSDHRSAHLGTDQKMGQLGTYALEILINGDPAGYFATRRRQDLNPHKGDGGYDVTGREVDIKTSYMRRNPDPLAYRLAVRPAERHPHWCYILALVPTLVTPLRVLLIGWALDDELRAPETEGVFEGAHTITAPQLHPVSGLDHAWKRQWQARFLLPLGA